MCLVFSYLQWCLLSRVLKAWTDLSSSQEGQSKRRRKSFQCIISTSLDTVYWLCIVLHRFLWGFFPMYYLFSCLCSPVSFPSPSPISTWSKLFASYFWEPQRKREMLSEFCAQPEVFPKLEASEAFDLLLVTREIPDMCILWMPTLSYHSQV